MNLGPQFKQVDGGAGGYGGRADGGGLVAGGWVKIQDSDFLANEAFFQIVLLAYNLLNWFKRLCVPPHLERATLPRLRQRLFLVPAQLVRPGGVLTLRLAPSYAYVADFLGTLRRIRRLRSPF